MYSMTEQALDRMMPMHVVVAKTGHIRRAGPTLAKLRPGNDLAGIRLLELFHLRRPVIFEGTVPDLRSLAGLPMQLEFRDPPHTQMRGILFPAEGSDDLIVNLSFGISALTALDAYSLSNSDFAPTDLTFELLYLKEAKSVVEAEFRRLAQHLETSRDEAEERALTDPLTGLGNRAAMRAHLNSLVSSGKPFAVMHLDLDLFKDVNDTLGHAAGDAVLCAVSSHLRGALRESDQIMRIGGDEFVILVAGLQSDTRLQDLSRDLIDRIQQPIDFEGQECRVSGSIGYTVSTGYDHLDADTLMAHSDTALYAAKRQGRGCAVAWTPDLPEMGQSAAAE